MCFNELLRHFIGLLRHVVSEKNVDVDFENIDVELSRKVLIKNVRHFDMSISKMSKKSLILLMGPEVPLELNDKT